MLLSLAKTVGNTWYDIKRAWLFGDDLPSRLRLCSDFILYRLIKFTLPRYINQERTVYANGITLTYRLNRGDIQGIREVWLDEAYRLPFSLEPSLVVDLGANIGLTSIWLWQHYSIEKIIAVEPSPDNVNLIHRNFNNNNINATIVEAAIGSYDGIANFEVSKDSNLGKVSLNEEQICETKVKLISMATLLAELPNDKTVDLVKMDIEGGEEELLSGNLSWLTRVKAIIAEFHPDRIDYPGLVKIIEQQGFDYIAANTVHTNNMDAFFSLSAKDLLYLTQINPENANKFETVTMDE